MTTFFSDDDYKAYLKLMAEGCRKAGTEVWAWCLMPNHVHLILVPSDEDGLRAALGEAHRRYTLRVNKREECHGYLWQGRFHSFVMDEDYLVACARYVELNPVRAGLVKKPEDWPWSSARAHLAGKDDALVRVKPLLERIPDWRTFLAGGVAEKDLAQFRSHNNTGRPCGKKPWIEELESLSGRRLSKEKPGPKTGTPKNQ